MGADMNLLIRADSGPRVGTGHVMRMTALAGAWNRMGGRTLFLCGLLPGTLRRRIRDAGCQSRMLRRDSFNAGSGNDTDSLRTDALLTSAIASQFKADWVVVDGYAFDDSWQRAVKSRVPRLLVVDDYGHANHHSADLILNQNIYATPQMYADPEFGAEANSRRDPATLLCGTQYLMMRPEFSPRLLPLKFESADGKTVERLTPARAGRILVTFGGADPDNHTQQALQALQAIQQRNPRDARLQVDVVTGAEFRHRGQLDRFLDTSTLNVSLHHDVQRMSRLMLKADMAISAGGSTCYELARCGVPAVVVSIADNQTPLGKALQDAGTVVYAGHHGIIHEPLFKRMLEQLMMDPDRRKAMSEAGRKRVDGRGAERTAGKMINELFQLRDAQADDSRQLLTWRNESETRAVSFKTTPIDPGEHERWLRSRLADENCILQIAIAPGGDPVGHVRIQNCVQQQTAYITIGLESGYRGRGLGAVLIARATCLAADAFGSDRILAQIKPANVASRSAFAKAGYQGIAPTVIDGQAAIQMEFRIRDRDVQNFRRSA